MQVMIMVVGQVVIFGLQGCFDFNVYCDFREVMESVFVNVDVQVFNVDLVQVEYFDSLVLGMLLMLWDKIKVSNCWVSLVNCCGLVKQVLEIVNFVKLFEVS